MPKLNRVFLVGPMGAGKTTIGRLLAQQLRLEFIDSDKEIEDRTGADIPWIFDMEGEEGFRDREEQVIGELTCRDNIVLATGGGAVIRPENRNALGARGFVIYLHASIDQQVARTLRDRNRPLLQGDDPRAVLENLMEARDALYREIADFVVETGGSSPRSMAQSICRELAE
jgi:shikimate kinase